MPNDLVDTYLQSINTAAAVENARSSRLLLAAMEEQNEISRRQLDHAELMLRQQEQAKKEKEQREMAREAVFQLHSRRQQSCGVGQYWEALVFQTKLNSGLWSSRWFTDDASTYQMFQSVEEATAKVLREFEAGRPSEEMIGLRVAAILLSLDVGGGFRDLLKRSYANIVRRYRLFF